MRNFTAQMTSGRNDPTIAFIGMLNSMQRRDDNKLEREKQDRRLAFLDKKDDRRYLERMAKFDANQVRVLARDKMMDKRYQFGLDEAKRIREDNLAGSMYDTSGNIATTGPLEVQDTSKDNIFLDYDAIKENASSIPLIKTQSIDKITEDNNKILTTFNDLEEKYKDEPEKLDFEKLNAIKDFAPETYNKMNTVDIDLPENTGNYLKSIINTPNFLANKIVKYGKEGYDYLTTSEADKIRQAKDNPKTKEEKAAATLAEFNNKVALLRQKKKDNKLARESNKNIIQGQENYLYKNFSKYGDKTTIKEDQVLSRKDFKKNVSEYRKKRFDQIKSMPWSTTEKTSAVAAVREKIATDKAIYESMRTFNTERADEGRKNAFELAKIDEKSTNKLIEIAEKIRLSKVLTEPERKLAEKEYEWLEERIRSSKAN